MSVINDVLEALRFGGAMVWPLLVLAVIALAIMLDKLFVYRTRTRLPRPLIDQIETYGFRWEDVETRIKGLGPRNYAGEFLHVIVSNRSHPAWWVESRAADEASQIEKSLGRWLWILDTVVTAAPLLGLLGTIMGMVGAFKLFGASGLVDPAGVTGGVAEALIATALGICVALVALAGYNFFSDRQAKLMDEMERLGTRLIDRIRLDAGEKRS
ncbi:MAG TPA: MotA/TolQ/ExbB proton channel family protein [Alphaproteobacteria bacterium]